MSCGHWAGRPKLFHVPEGSLDGASFSCAFCSPVSALCCAGVPDEDVHMLHYALDAQREPVPFGEDASLDPTVVEVRRQSV